LPDQVELPPGNQLDSFILDVRHRVAPKRMKFTGPEIAPQSWITLLRLRFS
jgi:hypothetical protein